MIRYDPMDKLLKVTEAAEILHVHLNTLRRWSERGTIEAYRIGSRGDRRFTESEVAKFIEQFSGFKQNEP